MTTPRIRVTGYYYPEPDESDPSDPTGLTEDAFMELVSELDVLDDLKFEVARDDD